MFHSFHLCSAAAAKYDPMSVVSSVAVRGTIVLSDRKKGTLREIRYAKLLLNGSVNYTT